MASSMAEVRRVISEFAGHGIGLQDLRRGCIGVRGCDRRRDRCAVSSQVAERLDQRVRHCILRPCSQRADGHGTSSRSGEEEGRRREMVVRT